MKKDIELEKEISKLTRLPQRQYSKEDQIYYLQMIGNMLGLYNAVDLLNYFIIKEK